MTAARAFAVGVRKELRPMLLPWLAGLAVPLALLTTIGPGGMPVLSVSFLTCAVPALALIVGEYWGALQHGAGPGWVDATRLFALNTLFWGTLACCGVAGVLAGRQFLRLEALDGPLNEFPDLLASGRRGVVASRDPARVSRRCHGATACLVRKEIRLQRMVFVLATFYVFALAAFAALGHLVPGYSGVPFTPVTVFYGLAAATLAGSLASAEERQQGTLEWQALLPMASWRQWTVKALVVLGLTEVLAVVVPAVLAGAFALDGWVLGSAYAVTLGLVTIASLYISSLSASGLRAACTTVMVAGAGWFLVGRPLAVASQAIALQVGNALMTVHVAERFVGMAPELRAIAAIWLPLAVTVGLALLVLGLGLANHRSAEFGPRRAVPQALWILATLVAGVVVDAAAWGVYVSAAFPR